MIYIYIYAHKTLDTTHNSTQTGGGKIKEFFSNYDQCVLKRMSGLGWLHRGWGFEDVSSVILQRTFPAVALFVGQFIRNVRYTFR